MSRRGSRSWTRSTAVSDLELSLSLWLTLATGKVPFSANVPRELHELDPVCFGLLRRIHEMQRQRDNYLGTLASGPLYSADWNSINRNLRRLNGLLLKRLRGRDESCRCSRTKPGSQS